ncbi:MAG: hypothetical protein R3310_01450 [Candidatus Competibacteraceae bacterium]|nr:hypothetical protein [Candidatus Competibacteraceae bacterium]
MYLDPDGGDLASMGLEYQPPHDTGPFLDPDANPALHTQSSPARSVDRGEYLDPDAPAWSTLPPPVPGKVQDTGPYLKPDG